MEGLDQLSERMKDTVASIVPGITSALENRTNKIDLATAENWLVRRELQDIYKTAIHEGITSKTLSYSQALGGDIELRESLCQLFNNYFHPYQLVQAEQIVATPGATHCLDALLTTICDEGDSVLVPAPYWNGFGLHFRLRPRVNVVPVEVDWERISLNKSSRPLDQSLLPALDRAMSTAPDKSRIRALVMTNPHNPFGQCYPIRVLEEVVNFCKERNIHYISDELYALSQFADNRFVSALGFSTMKQPLSTATSIDNHIAPPTSLSRKRLLSEDEIGNTGVKRAKIQNWSHRSTTGGETPDTNVNSAMVHVLWSTSKDLCSSGIRMAALVSQSPRSRLILKSVALLSSMHLSSLSSLATKHLLCSEQFPDVVATLSMRLSGAHSIAAARFRRWNTPFITPDAGPFVFVRLGEKEHESSIIKRLEQADVMVALGRSFGSPGWCEGDGGFWVRITVAVLPETLWDGLQKIEVALGY